MQLLSPYITEGSTGGHIGVAYLTGLSPREGYDHRLGAAGHVFGHSSPGAEYFVIWVGKYAQETQPICFSHRKLSAIANDLVEYSDRLEKVGDS